MADARPTLKITEPVTSGMPVVKLATLTEPEKRGVVRQVGPDPCVAHKRCPGLRVSVYWNGQTGPCGVTCTARTIVKDGALTIPLPIDQPKPVATDYRCSRCGKPADAPPQSFARRAVPKRPAPILCELCQRRAHVSDALRSAPVQGSSAWARLSEWEMKFLTSIRKQAASGYPFHRQAAPVVGAVGSEGAGAGSADPWLKPCSSSPAAAYDRFDQVRGSLVPEHDPAFEALGRQVLELERAQASATVVDDWTTLGLAHRQLDVACIPRVGEQARELPIHERVGMLIARTRNG